jgi:hypothetical protein
MATVRDYGAIGTLVGDEVVTGFGGSRPTQRIRPPALSMRGSTPKLF